jgi:protoheme IX farnesyltransferase
MVGGSLVTAASNGANQIWERELDIMMRRTQTRPLPQGRMNLKEAYLVVILCLVLGTWLLYRINFLSAFLGLCAFISYVFIYTPMKRVSPWAVFVGAFPGAIPPMLGAIAYTNKFGLEPGILFFVQFVWQFPHFWAIAWLLHDDYQKAGYWLLPSLGGRDKKSAYQIMIYTVILIMVSMMPMIYALASIKVLVVILPMGLYFLYKAYRLFKSLEINDARKLLYASFLYTPVVFLSYILF